MLSKFSTALLDLYHVSDTASVEEYLSKTVKILGRLFDFDGAIFGTGNPCADELRPLAVDSAFARNPASSVLADYADLAPDDPMTQAFLKSLAAPLICSSADCEANTDRRPIKAFIRRHKARQLLLFGTPGHQHVPTRWLALYRSNTRTFDQRSALLMKALWPHVAQSGHFNRCNTLQRHTLTSPNRGFAVVSLSGRIETANATFEMLSDKEWAGGLNRRIPEGVMSCWRRGRDFIGTRLRVTALPCGEYVLCELRERGVLDLLSRAERLVATHYGRGLSNTEIAHHLNLSTHTVRSHIAHVFLKLQIHSKAELARRLAEHEKNATDTEQ